MKKVIFLVLLFTTLISHYSFSNDAYLEVAGGNVTPIDSPFASAHSSITMKSEVIKIDLQKDYYHVHVNFDFYNEGETQTIKVGFPQWHYGTSQKSDFRNFTSTSNNKITEYEIINDKETPANKNHLIDKWYVREITFPSKQITKTSVDYDCDYGVAGYNKSIEYLFGTGKTWKNPIGSQTIEITNNLISGKQTLVSNLESIIIPDRVFFEQSDKWIKISSAKDTQVTNDKEKIIITRKNVSPDFFDIFSFAIENAFFLDDTGIEEVLKYINKELDETQLKFFTKEQLCLLRNLIFAKHGQIFKSQDLNNWFKDAPWYKPTHNVELSELTELELKNLKAIQKEEAKR